MGGWKIFDRNEEKTPICGVDFVREVDGKVLKSF